MSSFTDPLDVRITQRTERGRVLVEILKEFRYHVGDEASEDVIAVPPGFETDFASIPRGLWNLFPPLGPYTKAAVIHDWGYSKHDRSRLEYDQIFLEAMEVLGVPRLRRMAMYRAVRMFGGMAWRT